MPCLDYIFCSLRQKVQVSSTMFTLTHLLSSALRIMFMRSQALFSSLKILSFQKYINWNAAILKTFTHPQNEITSYLKLLKCLKAETFPSEYSKFQFP